MQTRMKTKGATKPVGRKTSKGPLAFKHKEYLSLLSKAKNRERRNKLIDIADGSEVRAVSECIKNILEGNVPLKSHHLKQMKRYKVLLRSLAKKCYPQKKKKILLKQKGGFIASLIPLAVSALGGILPQIFKGLSG